MHRVKIVWNHRIRVYEGHSIEWVRQSENSDEKTLAWKGGMEGRDEVSYLSEYGLVQVKLKFIQHRKNRDRK